MFERWKEMIVPITGMVTYIITMDPSVWIFDDRKILLDEAFSSNKVKTETEENFQKTERIWTQEVYQQKVKPPVNRSIKRFERDKILKSSYVMPIKDFIEHAEIKSNAKDATLITKNENINISLEDLESCYLLFAIDGKTVKEDGPVHLYYKDGSNRDNPIKGIKKIIIN